MGTTELILILRSLHLFGGTRRYYGDITECILVLRNLSLYGSTRKYYKTYTGTSYLILVLRSISWSYETYTCITDSCISYLILVLRILHGAYSDIKVPVGTTEILRNVYWYCGTYPYSCVKVPVGTISRNRSDLCRYISDMDISP